ncbi:hypothetical protein HX13_08880 [Chryseobacterium sp. P1-3]|uniref:hypothetical protein n=1 Tax=Chryseobacterium sp. (strain P1-3) TaxID=1517683 RepID=UPI0004E6394E|nr:hypothetical protein [Chryseobacterium sp. P1-3]KFF75035.1 hypothetical protein HX13_08880 [Chryseobacterium sp. P1-3]
MNIDEFRAELEVRLLIEKEYLIREAVTMRSQERLELLGQFNEKYRKLIKRLADESGIDLYAPFDNSTENSDKKIFI